jgi:subtilisin family serine protease
MLKQIITVGILVSSSLALASEYKSNEVIVKYKDGAVRDHATMTRLYDSVGVQSVKRYSAMLGGMEQLVLNGNVKVQDAISSLQQNKIVEYAQPNYIVHILPISRTPERSGDGSGIPCIPGYNIPGCDPGTGPGGGGGGIPCIPGMEIPGCTNAGGGGSIPCIPGMEMPGCSGRLADTRADARPPLQAAPAEINPPIADPDLDKSYGMAKIGATEAWKTFRGSKNFIVADIDTGVDYNHEDLAFNLWRNPNPSSVNDIVGYDFVHNDGLPYDDNEHGTHTAGTIAAVGGNGKGTSGVAQRVSLMALKFISGEGSGTTADAIHAIDYAVQHGARVLNNSWGGQADNTNQALSDAISAAGKKGVLFVVASGNDGVSNDDPTKASYPAAFTLDNIISVAATDPEDEIAFFSNFGVKSTQIAAPGTDVYSTIPGNAYETDSGTSMACPHVTGAAALLWARHPGWSYQKVRQVLFNTVDPAPSLQDKVSTGGRLNIEKAMAQSE